MLIWQSAFIKLCIYFTGFIPFNSIFRLSIVTQFQRYGRQLFNTNDSTFLIKYYKLLFRTLGLYFNFFMMLNLNRNYTIFFNVYSVLFKFRIILFLRGKRSCSMSITWVLIEVTCLNWVLLNFANMPRHWIMWNTLST